MASMVKRDPVRSFARINGTEIRKMAFSDADDTAQIALSMFSATSCLPLRSQLYGRMGFQWEPHMHVNAIGELCCGNDEPEEFVASAMRSVRGYDEFVTLYNNGYVAFATAHRSSVARVFISA